MVLLGSYRIGLIQFFSELFQTCGEFKRHGLQNDSVIITMRRKKGQGDMMQQAIDKASQLIDLLQKQNKDLKKKLMVSDQESKQLQREHHQLQNYNQELNLKVIESQHQLKETLKELEQSRQAVHSMEQSLKKRIHSNKQLHQKISLLTAKLKEKSKELNEQKTKMLSLENQNQYLLKKIQKNDELETLINDKMASCHQNRQKQLKDVMRVKQAFSRRCQELQADNNALILAAAQYKQHAIDKTIQTQFQPIKPPPLRQSPVRVTTDNFLSHLIRQKLGVEPQLTVDKQYQQLSSFLEYRLSHIQKLCYQIYAKLEGKDTLKAINLRDIHSICQRITTYVGQLITHSA